jgi:CheY-like chemotaxis protein
VDSERDLAPDRVDDTILLVEDEVLLRILIADVLRAAGFRVVEAGNADEAVNYIKSGGLVDLVFTDNEMPGVMNGAALIRWLHADFPKLKCIITSGRAAPEIARIAPFIAKPYDLDEAVERIRNALGQAGHESSHD